jgi:hypothetical protein
MKIDLAALNNLCLSAFAEPALFSTFDGEKSLKAIFELNMITEGVGSANFSSFYSALTLLKSDIDANQIALRDTVQVRDISYQILEISEDIAGMAKLKIRQYI